MRGPFGDRTEAPLSTEMWTAIDAAVREAARRLLVGRRCVPCFGPLGAGAAWLPSGVTGGTPLPLIPLHVDFMWDWATLAWLDATGAPPDVAPAVAAARQLAVQEDSLLFHGDAVHGVPGLLTVPGHAEWTVGAWDAPGAALESVLQATTHLAAGGFGRPWVVIVDPATFAQWHRPWSAGGDSDAARVRDALGHPVEVSAVLPTQTAVVLPLGDPACDWVVGLDWTVGWLETTDGVARFRILETGVPRIREPQAIGVLRVGSGQETGPSSQPHPA